MLFRCHLNSRPHPASDPPGYCWRFGSWNFRVGVWRSRRQGYSSFYQHLYLRNKTKAGKRKYATKQVFFIMYKILITKIEKYQIILLLPAARLTFDFLIIDGGLSGEEDFLNGI